MKKVLTILLSAAMMTSSVCFGASAADTSNPKERLKLLIDFLDDRNQLYGGTEAYGYSINSFLSNAKEVYFDEASTDEDYSEVYSEMISSVYSANIDPEYARQALENIEQEQNYNNWYSPEDWELLQTKISAMRSAADDYSETQNYRAPDKITGEPTLLTRYIYSDEQSKALTYAFHDLLQTVNTVAEKDFVKGDVDGDGSVTVGDSTMVQLYLADLCELTIPQRMRAEVKYRSFDKNDIENPTVDAATEIQLCLAELTDGFDNIGLLSEEIESHETPEFIKSHLMNYFFCPCTREGIALGNTYYLSSFIQPFYDDCIAQGIDF